MAQTPARLIARIPGEGANVIPVVGDGVTLDANTTKPTGSGRVLPFSFVPTWTGSEAELKAQIASNPGALVDDAPRFQAYVTQCIRLGWPLDVNGVIYCANQMSFVAVGPRLDIKNIGHAVLVGGPTITGRLLKIINTSGATARATDGSLFGINFDIEKMPTGALNSANALEVTGFRRFDIDCCNFYSGDNYQTAGGDSHIFFTNGGGRITRCNFTGAVDLGIYVSGTYNGLQDKEGLLIQGNTFKNCANAWSMKRNFQNWRAIGNWYKGCRNGAGLPGDMTDATGEGLKTGSLGIISGDIHQNCVASCLDFRDTHGVKADIVVSGTFGVDKDGNQTTSACAVKLDNADGCDITFLYEATSTDSSHSAVRIQNGSVDNRVRGVVMGTIANGLLETNGNNNTVDLKLGATVTAPGTIVGANTQFIYDKQGTREFLIGPYSRLAGRRPFSTTVRTATTTVNLNAVNRTIQFQPADSTVKAILPTGAVNGDEISILRKSGSGAGMVQVRDPGDTATILNLTDAGQIASFRWDGTAWIFVARSVSDRVLTLVPTASSSVATPPTGSVSLFLDSSDSNFLSIKDSAGRSPPVNAEIIGMTRNTLAARPVSDWEEGAVVEADGLFYHRVEGATAIADMPGWEPWPARQWNLRHFGGKPYDKEFDNGVPLQKAFNLVQTRRSADKGCGGITINIDPGEWWFKTRATCNVSPSGSASSGVGESGVRVTGAGEDQTYICAHSTNTSGCIRLTSQRNTEIKAVTDMTFLSDLDKDAATNNGIALQIDAQLNSGDAGYGDHPKWSAIVERVTVAGYGVASGDLANRGNWLKGIDMSNIWYPRLTDVRCLSRYASAASGATASTHAIHLRDCYSPDVERFYIQGVWQKGLWSEQEDGASEDFRFVNGFVVGPYEGIGVVNPLDNTRQLYEPGGVIDIMHVNCAKNGIVIRNRRQVQIDNLYGYLAYDTESATVGEDLPAIVLLDGVGDARVTGEFLEPGFYVSDTNASVSVRVEGSTEAVVVQGQFGGGGIGLLNNSTSSNKTIIVYSDMPTSRRSTQWTAPLKTVVDNVGGVMLRENRQTSYQDKTAFLNSKSSSNTYPIAVRVGSKLVGQAQVGAYEFGGVNAAGDEITTGIIRSRITANTAGSDSSTLDGFLRYQGSNHLTFSFDPVTANGQASLSLQTRIDGNSALKRIMIGADGSGPGGVGRALYVL
ncbi:hypothetical protein [Sphingobium abikonense]|uniref:hypothetical protein n=1 Tax=Sphingobium abikonense TaxID=86193 RepID=UPI0035162FDD